MRSLLGCQRSQCVKDLYINRENKRVICELNLEILLKVGEKCLY
jgi:hypothetical protein